MSRHLNDSDFRSDLEKWTFLEGAPKRDALEPLIQSISHALAACVDNDRERFIRLAAAYARDVIRYQTDTERVGQEDIQPEGELSDIVHRGVDDCDGKARLFCALCIAQGIDARMVPHWTPTPEGGVELSHVSAEVLGGGGVVHVPVELTLYRARVGDLPDDVPKEKTGHWLKNEVKK